MLMHARMMFARTRPNVGTHMDRISACVKMDGRVTPVIKVKHTIFFSLFMYTRTKFQMSESTCTKSV